MRDTNSEKELTTEIEKHVSAIMDLLNKAESSDVLTVVVGRYASVIRVRNENNTGYKETYVKAINEEWQEIKEDN